MSYFDTLIKSQTVKLDGGLVVTVKQLNALQRIEYENEIQNMSDDWDGFVPKAGALLAKCLYSASGEKLYANSEGNNVVNDMPFDALLDVFKVAAKLNKIGAAEERVKN